MNLGKNHYWRIVATSGLACLLANVLSAATPKMRPYTIYLPNHVLQFSLPEEIAQQMAPLQVEKRFEPTDAAYTRNGFFFLASKYYQFQGSFWAGAYGALRFEFSVVRRESEYRGEITTIDGLDRYLSQWRKQVRTEEGYRVGVVELSGARWVYQQKNAFGHVAEGAEDKEVFSCPLDETMYLDVSFSITETMPGSAAKWKAKAEAFREAIKASIVLEPKTRAATGASRP